LQKKVDKVQAIVDETGQRIEELEAIIAKAVDRIFASFCAKIGCANIRVYEDIQNSRNQAQGEEMLRTTNAVETFKAR
jgi:structural maintenance of chromosome 1